MLPEIARTPSLSAKAKELIEQAIWSGQLAPGSHLVETQLAAQFQISRGPLREALKALAAEGAVEIQPGRGAFVASPSADEMQEMIALRAVLSGMAARLVTANADAAVSERLATAVAGMRAAVAGDDERTFFDNHWAFYEAMYRSTNAFLFRAWASLHGLIDIYVRQLGRPYMPLSSILAHHERFIAAFEAGDPDEAEALVRSQFLIVGAQVLQRPIPKALHGYVTREIRRDGSVARFDAATQAVPEIGS